MTPTFERSLPSLYALANPIRIKILATLATDGPVSFSVLSKSIGINGPKLVHHLNKLHGANLVLKKVSNDPNSPLYRIYEISPAGREWLGKLE